MSSAETDVGMGISKQGDAMARHYLYQAANVLLTTVKKRFALRNSGLSWSRRSVRSAPEWRSRVAQLVADFAAASDDLSGAGVCPTAIRAAGAL